MHGAGIVDPAEQFLPGQVLARPDDPGQSTIAVGDLVDLAGLAREVQADGPDPSTSTCSPRRVAAP